MKRRILKATLSVLDDGEKVNFSMRAVAKAANVTATEIYRHFRDKRELNDALIAEARRLLGEYQLKALRVSTPLERLWEIGNQYVAFAIDYPQLYQLLFVRPISGAAPHYPTEMGPEQDLPFQMVVDRVRECIECGDLKPVSAENLALIIWSQAHGLCMLYQSGRLDAAQLKAMSREAFSGLLNGIEKTQGADVSTIFSPSAKVE